MIESKELRKIVRFCQKNGILKFKSGDFEIELGKQVKASIAAPSQNKETIEEKTFPSWESLTPEQKLLWSSTPDITDAGNNSF